MICLGCGMEIWTCIFPFRSLLLIVLRWSFPCHHRLSSWGFVIYGISICETQGKTLQNRKKSICWRVKNTWNCFLYFINNDRQISPQRGDATMQAIRDTTPCKAPLPSIMTWMASFGIVQSHTCIIVHSNFLILI